MAENMLDAEKKIQLLIKFGGLISYETHLDNLLELIAEQVRHIIGGDRCAVFLLDNSTQELWSKVAQGIGDNEIRVPIGRGVVGIVALTGKSVNIKDAYCDLRFEADIDKVTGYKTRNVMAVPLKNNKGEMLGVFQILNKINGEHFDDNDEGLLFLLGSVAAGAIENAQLYANIKKSQLETIYRLAVMAEYRDQQDTAKHLKNISRISATLASALKLNDETVENISYASPLHDIGKVGVPDSILLKPGELTPPEYEEMKKHTEYGAKILDNAESNVLRAAQKIAYSHHEKFDGTGYPQGLKGAKIPLEARIVSVADVFDALCMPRVYKEAWDTQKAFDYMLEESGKSFDPWVLDGFKSVFDTVRKFYDEPENI